MGANAEVDKAAFSLPVGGVSGPIATSDGTVIVKVVQRDVITPEQVKSGSETFRAELLNERRNQFFNAYMGKAKERMKVEINAEVISRVTSALRPVERLQARSGPPRPCQAEHNGRSDAAGLVLALSPEP